MSEQDFERFVARQLEALRGCLVTEYRCQVRKFKSERTELCSVEPVEESASFISATSPNRGLPGTVAEPFGAPPALEYVPKQEYPRSQERASSTSRENREGPSRPGSTVRQGLEPASRAGSVALDSRQSPSRAGSASLEKRGNSGLDGDLEKLPPEVNKVKSLDFDPEAAAAADAQSDNERGVTWKKSSCNRASEQSEPEPDRRVSTLSVKSHTKKRRNTLSGLGEDRSFFEDARLRNSTQQFEPLPVWTSGGAANRRFIYSMRSKSAFLEFKEVRTNLPLESHLGEKKWMIHPSDMKHLIWDVFGLALITYDCITIPMEVFDPEDNAFQILMTWIIRLYWTFNIAMSFLTGYLMDNGTVEMRPREVAKRYAVTWLPLDLFIVGLDWAEAAVDSFGSFQRFGTAMRSLRMIRTVRLVRLIKAPEITGFVNEHIRSEQVLLSATIVKIISLVLGIAHLIACAWYGMGRFSSWGPGENSWIKRYHVREMDVGQRYAVSFHWSLSMVAGELTHEPQNGTERVFTICVLFFAIMISASFVSSLTTTMTQLRMVTSQQSSQLSKLRRFLLDHEISRELAVRIQRNAQFSLIERAKNAPESSVELLLFISNPLMVELHFEIHSHWLMEHPFFFMYYDVNPGGIRKVCHIAVATLPLSKGDVLFHDLEVATQMRMYFITRGGLEYKQEEKEVQLVHKGNWLCEAVLWTTWTHCGTARANAESRLLVLDAEKFQDIVGTFPSEHAQQYATEYVEQLNTKGPSQLSDLSLDRKSMDEMLDRVFPEDSDTCSDSDCEETTRDRRDSKGSQPGSHGEDTLYPSTEAATAPRGSNRFSGTFSEKSANDRHSVHSSHSRKSQNSRRGHNSGRSRRSQRQKVGFQLATALGRLSSPFIKRLSAGNHNPGRKDDSSKRPSSNVVPP